MILSCPRLVSFCAALTFCKHLQEAETGTRCLFEALGTRGYRFPGDRRARGKGNPCGRVTGEATGYLRGCRDRERAPSVPKVCKEQLL